MNTPYPEISATHKRDLAGKGLTPFKPKAIHPFFVPDSSACK